MPDGTVSEQVLRMAEPPTNHAHGGPIQGAGCGESGIIQLRDAADGTIANAATVINNNIDSGGWINVIGCTSISMWITVTIGSLNSVEIFPILSMDQSDNFQPLVLDTKTTNIGTYTPTSTDKMAFKVTTGFTGVIVIPTFNTRWMRFHVSSVGTITNSALKFAISRGWCPVTSFEYGKFTVAI